MRWLWFLKGDEKGSEKSGVEKSEEGEGVVVCGEERVEERESGERREKAMVGWVCPFPPPAASA